MADQLGPLICIHFWAKSVQGRIQGRAIIRQWVAPSAKNFFRVGMLQQQTECIAIIYKHLGRSVVILVSFGSQIFDTYFASFWTVILVYFNAISIDFYAIKSFIYIIYKWVNAYSRRLNAWGILMKFYLFLQVKSKCVCGGGCTSTCICIGTQTHRVSLNYRIAWWIFTKLGRDKVLMTPAHLYRLLGQIRPGMDPGQGHNRSMRGSSPKDFFFRVGRLQQQTECIAVIQQHLGRSFVIFGSILTCSFWHALVLCIGLLCSSMGKVSTCRGKFFN